MCGFVGIFDTTGRRPLDKALLRRMNNSLTHRGPDGEGYHFEDGLGFGHRRLAIIDLQGGQQPIYNEDGSIFVVFNGEIYNYKKLRKDLEFKGHRFRTESDTEVIVGVELDDHRCTRISRISRSENARFHGLDRRLVDDLDRGRHQARRDDRRHRVSDGVHRFEDAE